jgi:hypothetical protein
MKTYNYNIDLIVPMQIDREIIVNEALLTIDNFCNSAVLGFITNLPLQPIVGTKYIFSSGENKGYICYCIDLSKGWQFLQPRNGMIVFVYQENNFFIFHQDEWKSILKVPNILTLQQNFTAIDTEFTVPNYSNSLYLYLNNDCIIRFTNTQEITIILKQNSENMYKVSYYNNIKWQNNLPHEMTRNINAIDIVRFYPLAGTDVFLAEIIGQNY